MATLGDLVVRFSANSRDFDRKTDRMRASLGSLAVKATAVASAIGGAFALKSFLQTSVEAAANVEALTVRFDVMIRNINVTNDLMGKLNKLAAETPFQKMEIGEAAQKLLAFGSGASEVVDEIRMLGDIGALTGNSLTELAELYGKARVQGRLFGEDVNQLTGRGIPVIGEFAKQFGVAESEVKKLVEQGRIGFPQLQEALRSLTTGTGLFAGGMERLSTTTQGLLSTMRDKFIDVAAAVGQRLLPVVNKVLDAIIRGFESGGFMDRMVNSLIVGVEKLVGALEKVPFIMQAINEGHLPTRELVNQMQHMDKLMDDMRAKAKAEREGKNALILSDEERWRASSGVNRDPAAQALASNLDQFSNRFNPFNSRPAAIGDEERRIAAMNAAATAGGPAAAVLPFHEGGGFDILGMLASVRTGTYQHQQRFDPDQFSAMHSLFNFFETQMPMLVTDALGSAGQLLGETFQGTNSPTEALTGALVKGSQEAYSAILSATRGRSVEQAQLQTAQATEQSASLLGEIATGFQSYFANAGVVESFGT